MVSACPVTRSPCCRVWLVLTIMAQPWAAISTWQLFMSEELYVVYLGGSLLPCHSGMGERATSHTAGALIPAAQPLRGKAACSQWLSASLRSGAGQGLQGGPPKALSYSVAPSGPAPQTPDLLKSPRQGLPDTVPGNSPLFREK